ncbi:methyltransferase domain-containing protein [Acetobacteraceae bacterium KSS8]|uniref:Methyltransferase domain-containing protein n=1 Tax=Endosaccharibacter trunci TaxID=2812733 RepID=A0ABT1WA26_9PROT|nr:methyltransferase domain-containing protein [Acetobacteraceae bacterium KSS8]
MGQIMSFAGRVVRGVPRRLRRAAFELAGKPLPIPNWPPSPQAGPVASPAPAAATSPSPPSPTPEPHLHPDLGTAAIQLHGWFRADRGELYPQVPVGPDDVVADIGCGDGGAGLFCAGQGARVILSDLDGERLEQARARVAAAAPGRVEALHGNGEALPIGDGTATVTICMEVIEHVDHPPALCAELFRITRPGGLLLIACPDPRSEAVQKTVAAPIYFEKPNHIRIVQHDELQGWVRGAGFEILRCDTYGFYEAVKWSMFWSVAVDLGQPHPVYEAWEETWRRLLDTKDGEKVQRALDAAFPKSQVVVAHRP